MERICWYYWVLTRAKERNNYSKKKLVRRYFDLRECQECKWSIVKMWWWRVLLHFFSLLSTWFCVCVLLLSYDLFKSERAFRYYILSAEAKITRTIYLTPSKWIATSNVLSFFSLTWSSSSSSAYIIDKLIKHINFLTQLQSSCCFSHWMFTFNF